MRKTRWHLLYIVLWRDFFEEPIDTVPSNLVSGQDELKHRYYTRLKWPERYDFMEFLSTHVQNIGGPGTEGFRQACNRVLARHMSAWRFAGGQLVPITSEEELAAIDEAAKTPVDEVAEHIRRAVGLYADRKSPDYPNSIKESISAVESFCSKITGGKKADLALAMAKLEGAGISLHGALKEAFKKLYGWTSDEDGVRHAMMDLPNLDEEDARFMLVACSAFVNYLVVKDAKAK